MSSTDPPTFEYKVPETLGSRVRALRLALELSQEQLAWSFGRRNRWVSDIELGKRKVSIEDLKQLADLLNTSPNYLVAGTERVRRDGEDGGTQIAELRELYPSKTPVYKLIDYLAVGSTLNPVPIDYIWNNDPAGHSGCMFACKQNEFVTFVFHACETPLIGDKVLLKVRDAGGDETRVLGEVVSFYELDDGSLVIVENVSGQFCGTLEDVHAVLVSQIITMKRGK